jgi:hypothetical protein
MEEAPYETGEGIHNIVMTGDNGGTYTFTSADYGTDLKVGDLVDVTMKIKASTTDVGTDYGFYTVKAGGEDKTIASKSTYSTEWTEVSFRVAVTAAQTNLKNWQMDTKEGISLVWLNNSLPMGYISMKDVTFTKYVPEETPADSADVTLTGTSVSGGAGPAAVTKLFEVDSSIAAGTTVTVTMTVALSQAGDYTRIHAVVKNASGNLTETVVYGFASGANASSQVATLKSGEYVTITFDAIVVENQSIEYYGVATPTTGKGVSLLFISMAEAGDSVWIKDVNIQVKA